MDTESGRIVTNLLREQSLAASSRGPSTAQSLGLSAGLAISAAINSPSPYFRQILFSCERVQGGSLCACCCQDCTASQDPGPSTRPLLQNEMPRLGPGQGPGQDRTGQDYTCTASCRRLLAPTGYSAQNMGHRPRVHHGSPSKVPPPPQRQSAVPQQPDNRAAQTSPGSPATIAFPFHHPTLNISPPKPSRPDLTRPRLWQPKPARPRLGGHTAQQPRPRPSSSRQSPGNPSHTLSLAPGLSPSKPSHLTRSPAPLAAAALLADPCLSLMLGAHTKSTQPCQPTCPPASLLGTSPMPQPCLRVPAYLWTLG